MNILHLAALGAALCAAGFVAYEIRLRRSYGAHVAAVKADNPASVGFLPLLPLATTLGSAALSALMSGVRESVSAGAAVTVAAIKVAPDVLKAVSASPLLAFIFGGVLFGLAGLAGGSHIRKGADGAAVRAAFVREAPGVHFASDVETAGKSATTFVKFVVASANARAEKAIATAKAEAVDTANKRADKAIADFKAANPAKPAAVTAAKKGK